MTKNQGPPIGELKHLAFDSQKHQNIKKLIYRYYDK